MRIGLIGDVHAQDERLQMAIEEFSRMGLDMLLAVGDYLNGPGNVNRVVQILKENSVLCVKGNHDVHYPSHQEDYENWLKLERENAIKYAELVAEESPQEWMLELYRPRPFTLSSPEPQFKKTTTHWSEIEQETIDFIETLPTQREVDTPDGKLLLCHAMGEDVYGFVPSTAFSKPETFTSNEYLNKILEEKHYSFVVCGHTHEPYLGVREGIVFANAGTLSRGFYACYCVLDTDKKALEIYRFWKSDNRKRKGPIVMRAEDR